MLQCFSFSREAKLGVKLSLTVLDQNTNKEKKDNNFYKEKHNGMWEDSETALTAFEPLSRQPEGRHLEGRFRLLCGHPKVKKSRIIIALST